MLSVYFEVKLCKHYMYYHYSFIGSHIIRINLDPNSITFFLQVLHEWPRITE